MPKNAMKDDSPDIPKKKKATAASVKKAAASVLAKEPEFAESTEPLLVKEEKPVAPEPKTRA